jgi:cytochrome b involved in lipid metabolism
MEKNKIILIVIGFAVLVSFGAYFFISSKNSSYSSNTPQQSESSVLADCIITVRGEKYNVKDFRKLHKGGDIFKCDTDMTEAFNNQHGEKQLQKLQQYIVK